MVIWLLGMVAQLGGTPQAHGFNGVAEGQRWVMLGVAINAVEQLNQLKVFRDGAPSTDSSTLFAISAFGAMTQMGELAEAQGPARHVGTRLGGEVPCAISDSFRNATHVRLCKEAVHQDMSFPGNVRPCSIPKGKFKLPLFHRFN
jgi:hypothetical protein